MECMECGLRWHETRRTGRPRQYCSRSCQGRAYRRRRDQGRLSRPVQSGMVEKQSVTTLQTAIAMADAQGIDTVTLRSVASQAGMALTALERSFGSRDRLVDAMVQHILSSPPAPSTRIGDPIDTLIRLAEHEWEKYGSHPWLVTVMARTRPPLVPATLDSARVGIEAIREAGVDSNIALDRYLAISAYVQGMALLLHAEQQEIVHSDTSLRAWWSEEVNRLDRRGLTQRHHWLADLTHQSLSDGYDVDACFRDGLHRVVAGLVQPTSQ